MNNSKLPWVFWLNISIRRDWFKRFWKTRGANFLEMQAWIFKISIGMPWLQGPVSSTRKNYGSYDYIRKTNLDNLKQPFSIAIGKNVIKSLA